MPRSKRTSSTPKKNAAKSEEEEAPTNPSQESSQDVPDVASPGGTAQNLKLKLKVSGPPAASSPPAVPASPAPAAAAQAAVDPNLKIKIKVPTRGDDAMEVEEPKPTPSAASSKSKGTPLKKSTTFTDLDGMEVEDPDAPAPVPAVEHGVPNKQTPRASKADSAGASSAAAATRKNKRKAGTGAASGPSVGSAPSTSTPGGTPANLSSSTADIFAGDGMETDTLDEGDDGTYNSDSDADLLDGRGRKKGQVAKSKQSKAKRVPRQTKPKTELDENFENVGVTFDEDPHSAGHYAATILWKNVEVYFGDLSQEDLSYLDTSNERPSDNDKAFSVPKLGPHYLAQRSRAPGMGFDQTSTEAWGGFNAEASSRADTLFSRIMSLFIEEANVTTDLFGTDELDSGNGGDMGQTSDDMTQFQDTELLEQRLQQELLAIGLLDETEGLENPKEDDEICAELRKLQIQLKQQMGTNARMKKQIYDKAMDEIDRQQEARDKRQQMLDQEKALLDKMKRFKKRKRPDEEGTT